MSKISNVNPGDTISGALFRKFVDDYKAYDAKQKEIIANQRKEINKLIAEVNYYKKETPEERDKKTLKIRRQAETISEYQCKITKLKAEVKRLQNKLYKLENNG